MCHRAATGQSGLALIGCSFNCGSRRLVVLRLGLLLLLVRGRTSRGLLHSALLSILARRLVLLHLGGTLTLLEVARTRTAIPTTAHRAGTASATTATEVATEIITVQTNYILHQLKFIKISNYCIQIVLNARYILQ